MVDYSELDLIFSALADPTRRALVSSLAEKPRTVSELATPFDLTLAGVSKHLKVLQRAGLVVQTRRGRTVECSLEVAPLHSAASWAQQVEQFWTSGLARLEAVVLEQEMEETASGKIGAERKNPTHQQGDTP